MIIVDQSVHQWNAAGTFVPGSDTSLFVRKIITRTDGSIVLRADSTEFDDEVVDAMDVSKQRIMGKVIGALQPV